MDDSRNAVLPTALENGTTLGPLREGQRLAVTCEVLDTRPAPLVSWWRSGRRVANADGNDADDEPSPGGLFTRRAKLSLVLTRAELAATYECRIETPALAQPLHHLVHVDLQVRPTKLQMTGLTPSTVQGAIVQVMCVVVGARPAANITWYNNTTPLLPGVRTDGHRSIGTKLDVRNDGTFQTLSKMVFTASRYENGMTVRCEAENVVMREEGAKALKESYRMEVTCK